MGSASYQLLDEGLVVGYAAERGLIEPDHPRWADPWVKEVTDGNLNRVFLLRPAPDVPGVALKQALPWLRVIGESWPLGPERAEAEARAYEVLRQVSPGEIPAFLGFDADNFVLAMEDLGHLQVLRRSLVAGGRYGQTSDRVGRLVARLAFATSDFGMDAMERKRLIARSTNPELCQITETFVLTGPFVDDRTYNRVHPSAEALVSSLREDRSFRAAAAELKHVFMTKAEALLHGDLHSGSVMVGDGRVVVIDPEFSFVGPVGFDLGLHWANALIAAVRAAVLGDPDLAADHAAQVQLSWTAFVEEWRDQWPQRVDRFFDDAYRERFLRAVWADGLGYAGAEALRRVAGYAHAEDIDSLDQGRQAAAVGWILRLGRELIVDRHGLADPGAVVDALATSRPPEAGWVPPRRRGRWVADLPVAAVVVDVEGTTSATQAILGDLYDYARPRLDPWLRGHEHEDEVAAALARVREEARDPAAPIEAVVAVLHRWMDDDVKATPLKTIQGRIWADGFAAGELQSHVFGDVVPQLRRWQQAGLRLAVFSSGSATSQQAWFAHTADGDLSGLFAAFFDTVNAGPKREPASYHAISQELGLAPDRIVFLSDVPAELDAAARAGWRVVGVARDDEPHAADDFGAHPVVGSFDDVVVRPSAPAGER